MWSYMGIAIALGISVLGDAAMLSALWIAFLAFELANIILWSMHMPHATKLHSHPQVMKERHGVFSWRDPALWELASKHLESVPQIAIGKSTCGTWMCCSIVQWSQRQRATATRNRPPCGKCQWRDWFLSEMSRGSRARSMPPSPILSI